ncbi:MAG: GlsB/YeaQ/YmgE family stress response membrane protein [Anaerolineaceae bacterium]|nr:GlsB/YeaQ/YmgE family stress response membrane protein [Anaerolineaceae bacterium]MCB9099639.1 GlsB/YeaQ/YmgE family stress response membrane protein [Anaerolineales bacterium]
MHQCSIIRLYRQSDRLPIFCYGLVGNLVIGVVGAIIGGYLFGLLGINLGIGGLAGSIIVAFVGAIILIFILGLIRR